LGRAPSPSAAPASGSTGAGLGGIPGLAKVLAPHGDCGRVLVDVGVVEKAEAELHGEQPGGRLVDPRLADETVAHEVEQQLDRLLATELVGACLDDPLHPLVRGQVLDTPRAGRQDLVADVVVVDELPVAEDDAVEAELLAQQPGHDLLVVAEADLLDLLAVDLEVDGHPVIGHDRRGPGLDDRRERLEVVGEPVARVDLLAAVGEVGVLPVLLRAAAGEVLADARDRVRSERIPLETKQIGDPELRDEVWVLPEGARLPGPARLGGQVERRVQRHPDADRDVLLSRDVAELAHEVGVAQRREPERLRPLRERLGGKGRPRVLDERVPWVGRDGDRYAVG
jgi:hypothetical protein